MAKKEKKNKKDKAAKGSKKDKKEKKRKKGRKGRKGEEAEVDELKKSPEENWLYYSEGPLSFLTVVIIILCVLDAVLAAYAIIYTKHVERENVAAAEEAAKPIERTEKGDIWFLMPDGSIVREDPNAQQPSQPALPAQPQEPAPATGEGDEAAGAEQGSEGDGAGQSPEGEEPPQASGQPVGEAGEPPQEPAQQQEPAQNP